ADPESQNGSHRSSEECQMTPPNLARNLVGDDKSEISFVSLGQKVTGLPHRGIALISKETFENVISFMAETSVWQAIGEDGPQRPHHETVSLNVYRNPEEIFLNPGGFVLDQQLATQQWLFRASTDKRRILQLVSDAVNRVPGTKTIRKHIVQAA